jgi:hypothetical protein
VKAVAIANNEIAIIAWDAPQPIDRCLGFAVYRIDLGSGQATPLQSWVGFQGQTNPDWKPQSTDGWPVQEYQWKDLEARRGGSYRYRIVPMIGTPGRLSPHPTLSWESNPVHLTPDRGGVLAYFNRGILSTEALAHQLPEGSDTAMYNVLKGRIDQPGDPLRDRLAGQFIEALSSLLLRAKQEGGQCYAALVLDVYDHYRFRYEVEQKGQDAWSGLSSTPDWQQQFFQADSDWRKVAAFWQGGIAPIGAVVPMSPPSANGPAAPDARPKGRRKEAEFKATQRKSAPRRLHRGRG